MRRKKQEYMYICRQKDADKFEGIPIDVTASHTHTRKSFQLSAYTNSIARNHSNLPPL